MIVFAAILMLKPLVYLDQEVFEPLIDYIDFMVDLSTGLAILNVPMFYETFLLTLFAVLWRPLCPLLLGICFLLNFALLLGCCFCPQ